DLPQAVQHRRQPRPQLYDDAGLRVALDLGRLPFSPLLAERGALTRRDRAFPGDARAFPGHAPGPEKPDVDVSVDSRNTDQNDCAYNTQDNVAEVSLSALTRQDPEHR